MVINPRAGHLVQETGKPVSCRIQTALFASEVSLHPGVLQLVHTLLKTQQEVEVYQFESLPEFTLDSIPGVRVIGPDKELSRRWNNKVYQHEALKGIVKTSARLEPAIPSSYLTRSALDLVKKNPFTS